MNNLIVLKSFILDLHNETLFVCFSCEQIWLVHLNIIK